MGGRIQLSSIINERTQQPVSCVAVLSVLLTPSLSIVTVSSLRVVVCRARSAVPLCYRCAAGAWTPRLPDALSGIGIIHRRYYVDAVINHARGRLWPQSLLGTRVTNTITSSRVGGAGFGDNGG